MFNRRTIEAKETEPDCLSNYELLSELGRGAHGIVYRSRRAADNKIVVVKCISTTNLKRRSKTDIMQEANFLKGLKHAHIVKYLSCFFEGLNFYIVMEYAEKGDLYKLTKAMKRTKKGFSEEEVWRCAGQLFSALEFIHEQKIVHRDIKPLNIFLDKNSNVKVGDFGVSKLLDPVNDLRKTKVGTPLYLAPEVVQHYPYGAKADIWSAGCVLYYIMMQRVPFFSDNVISLGFLIVNKDHDPLPQSFSKELRELINACMQKKPEKRPSASDILAKYCHKFGSAIAKSEVMKMCTEIPQIKEKQNPIDKNQGKPVNAFLVAKSGTSRAPEHRYPHLKANEPVEDSARNNYQPKLPIDTSQMFKKKKSKLHLKENIHVYNNLIMAEAIGQPKVEKVEEDDQDIKNSLAESLHASTVKIEANEAVEGRNDEVANKTKENEKLGKFNSKPPEKPKARLMRPSSVVAARLLEKMETRDELKCMDNKLNMQLKRIGLRLASNSKCSQREKSSCQKQNNFMAGGNLQRAINLPEAKPYSIAKAQVKPQPSIVERLNADEMPREEVVGLSFFHDSVYETSYKLHETRPVGKPRPRTAIFPQGMGARAPKPRLVRPNTAVIGGAKVPDYVSPNDYQMNINTASRWML